MTRTNSTDVQAILGDNYDGSKVLTPFIRTASILVDRVVTCAAAKGITLSSEELQEMECYLAAHFYGHHDQMYQSRSTGKASGSFKGQTAMALDGTQYGQTAKMLDSSGCLNSISQGQGTAKMYWLGLPPSEQTPYDQRD